MITATGLLDRSKEKRYRVLAHNRGSFGRAQGKFLNLRAESCWRLRDMLEEGSIALARAPALFQELLALRWSPTSEGKVRMEANVELKSRLGRNPDRADAVVMFASDLLAGSAKPFLWMV
jgi:hypothetical protein